MPDSDGRSSMNESDFFALRLYDAGLVFARSLVI